MSFGKARPSGEESGRPGEAQAGGTHHCDRRADGAASQGARPAGERSHGGRPGPARPAASYGGPARPQENLFTRGRDGSARHPRRTSKLAGSISRRLAWDLWARRLCAFIAFDLVLFAALVAGFIIQCNQSLPEEAFRDTWRILYSPLVQPGFVESADGVLDVAYQLSFRGVDYTFPLTGLYALMAVVFSVVAACQLVSLCDGVFAARRIRRRLKPLNDLALMAEAMGSATADNPLGANAATADKMEALKHAIDEADVNAPNVSTGDADLRSIEVALNGLLRQMQEAKLQQMRFVNDASHELRTPIAVIQGYVNMLDRWGKSDPEVLDESIAALKQESTHMQELVEQLLFLARGDAGRTNMHKERFDLGPLVREVYEESAMIDPSHAYRLCVQGEQVETRAMGEASDAHPRDVASMPSCPMVGDEALVKQAMRILVQNAVKYSPAGSQITVGLQAQGTKLACSVADEGQGLAPEEIPHAFERFWRADEARQSSAGGTGLGLSIAKWIMDAHAGRIDVVSVKDLGTRFTLEFIGE